MTRPSPFRFGSHQGQPLTLADQPLVSFPDGAFFPVTDPPNLMPGLVKVVEPTQRGPFLVERLRELRRMPASAALAWPVELVYEANQVVGYWTAPDAGALRLREWLARQADPNAPRRRLRLAQNLARTVQEFHEQSHCVLAAFSPESVLVRPNGQVQFINLDACQVPNPDGSLLLPGRVQESPYTPHEWAEWREKPFLLTPSWDAYALAHVLSDVLAELPLTDETRQALLLGRSGHPEDRPTTADWVQLLEREINPPPPPVIEYFLATPAEVELGEAVRLEWRTQHVSTVRLEGVPPEEATQAPEGSLWVFPEATASYTLTAGTAEQSRLVRVREAAPPPPPPEPPRIVAFDLSPTEVKAGQSVTASWAVEHAETANLSGPQGFNQAVAARGQTTLTPNQSGIYTLRAGQDERRMQVNVVPKPSFAWVWWLLLTLGVLAGFIGYLVGHESPAPESGEKREPPPASTVPPATAPRIESFTASPTTIEEGESVTLAWRVVNAGSVPIRLSGPGARAINRAPVESTTATPFAGVRSYELSVGSERARVTIIVREKQKVAPVEPADAAQIVEFAPKPETIAPGQEATLRWQVENAQSVRLFGPGGDMGEVSPISQRTVRPTQDAQYRLWADGETRKVWVRVQKKKESALHPRRCDDGLWGYADDEETLVIPCKFDEAEAFQPNGTANVVYQKAFRVINRRGAFID